MPWIQLKIDFGAGKPQTDVDFGLTGNAPTSGDEQGLSAVETMGSAVLSKVLKPTESVIEASLSEHLESLKENLP